MNPPLLERDFQFLAKLLKESCAIVVDPSKDYLLQSRLTPLARKHGFETLPLWIDRLRLTGATPYLSEFVEAMVTTETSFFRDVMPFELLRKNVLPEIMAAREKDRRLTIWCAASSSGQEPYTIALILKEYFPILAGWQVSLIATDISQEMVNRCKAGRYSQIEVNRGLPIALLSKYFTQEGSHWILDESIRRMVNFQVMNLALPWKLIPPVDILFIRNVMIYFDVETKKQIFAQLDRVLKQDGYLVLGAAETSYGICESFRRVERLNSGYFQRVKS